eukprot:TRINITY_DN6111_c0_g3_i1.p1 TRINITY_DN6111_c0_g3~~TRINITY_DN6111_c0_g3_i1.p1  ORF type:complete len:523 (-),score=118.79 TRINITY_DN6111_c0_g3_i1:67-1635(-)
MPSPGARRRRRLLKTTLSATSASAWQRPRPSPISVDGLDRTTSGDTMKTPESHHSQSVFSPQSNASALPPIQKSRSNFEFFRTADEDKEELRAVFLHAEALHDRESTAPPPITQRLFMMSRQQVEMTLDTLIGMVIVLNAVFIGFSLDAGAEFKSTVLTMDIFFSATFILELVLKLYMNGVAGQFCGQERAMNLFDATLILIDLLQLGLQVAFPSATSDLNDLPSASLFRVVRLARLVRILRLLRHPVLQTLLMMMHGMIGGLPTLGWALVLFVMAVYIVALLCREFLGREPHDNVYEYFNDVPRAMVTTFRCSFGECSSIDGTPIFEHVNANYGLGFSVLYCLFAFSMSIGMFNVISSIFVQSTMAAATGIKSKQKKARLQDESLWASRVTAIVRKLLAMTSGDEVLGKLSDSIDAVYALDVNCTDLDEIGGDPLVRALLEELDVDPEDHDCLSDILDVEQEGRVAVIELLQGIKRLRGNPRRSDIVTVDLMCRSMQNTLKSIHQLLLKPSSRERIERRRV